jgi:hypothetical protein
MKWLINWCATHILSAAVLFAAVIVVPAAWGLEQRMDDLTGANREKIEDVQDEVDDEVPGTEPTTPVDDESPSGSSPVQPSPTQPAPSISISDERIIQIIAEFCQENDCRPIFVDQAEVQEPEIQDPEIQDPEIQESEVQDAESQDPEIQEAPIPGPAGPAGPACPSGYSLREIRISPVSNTAIFLVCARG